MARKRAVSAQVEFSKLSRDQVAFLWAITPMAVTKWVKMGCPRNDDGSYDLPQVLAWRERFVRKDAGIEDDSGAASPQLERQRRLRADLLEIDVERERGLVINAREEEQRDVAKVRAVRQAMMSLPKRLSDRLAGETDKYRVLEMLTAAMKDLCDIFSKSKDEGEEEG